MRFMDIWFNNVTENGYQLVWGANEEYSYIHIIVMGEGIYCVRPYIIQRRLGECPYLLFRHRISHILHELRGGGGANRPPPPALSIAAP